MADDVISELSAGPEEEDDRDERPEPDSEQQEQELNDMLEGSDSGSGQTSGASDPTDVVSESNEENTESGPTTQEQGEEALEEIQSETESGTPSGDFDGGNPEVGTLTVDEVLENEGYERVDQIALEFEQEMRTGVPSLCELGCNVKPDGTCPHGAPSVIAAAKE